MSDNIDELGLAAALSPPGQRLANRMMRDLTIARAAHNLGIPDDALGDAVTENTASADDGGQGLAEDHFASLSDVERQEIIDAVDRTLSPWIFDAAVTMWWSAEDIGADPREIEPETIALLAVAQAFAGASFRQAMALPDDDPGA